MAKIVSKICIIMSTLLVSLLASCKGSGFPHRIKDTEYADQVKTEGVKSTFREGVIYRYPGIVPLLEVKGDHYEMGLQYGVLLRPEIIKALDSFKKIFEYNAKKAGISNRIFYFLIRREVKKLSSKVPLRFIKEAKGIAEGAGISVDDVLLISLAYDVFNNFGCTSVIMRDKEGKIIHGRNNDTTSFGADELGKLTVIVKHKADGLNEVTHMDYPLFMGIQTAYNSAGLSISEQTYAVKEMTKNPFPYSYLVRMTLETSSSIEDVQKMMSNVTVSGGHGIIWSDRKTNRAALMELIDDRLKMQEIVEPVFWDQNHILIEQMKEKGSHSTILDGEDKHRESIAKAYPVKEYYNVEDVVKFLRSEIDESGENQNESGSRIGICSRSTQQTIIFNHEGAGFYLGADLTMAAKSNIYYIDDDFSIPPVLSYPAEHISEYLYKIMRIKIAIDLDNQGKRDSLLKLTDKYPKKAYLYYSIAKTYEDDLILYNAFMEKALSLDRNNPEYMFLTGVSYFYLGNMEKAIEKLEQVDYTDLVPSEHIEGLTVLTKCYKDYDEANFKRANSQLEELLEKYSAREVYQDFYLGRHKVY